MSQHSSSALSERTVEKVESRRLEAVRLNLGAEILIPSQIANIVADLTPEVASLIDATMMYIGVCRSDEGPIFDREVCVRW